MQGCMLMLSVLGQLQGNQAQIMKATQEILANWNLYKNK